MGKCQMSTEGGLCRASCSSGHVLSTACVPVDTGAVGRAGIMKSRVAAYALTQSMSSHDLQQARVICKTEHLGGAGDLPAVFVEGGENDLTFGLSLQRLQSARSSCRIRDVIDLLCLNLRWSIGDVDDGSVRRNHHPLETVSQFADVILSPIVSREQCESFRRDGLGPHAEMQSDRAKEMIDENRDVR